MERDPGGAADETMKATAPPARSFASGRYVVRRVLGEGGQKLVYLVHDEALDRECALSVIKSDLLEPDDLLRLRREAQTMARLAAHSNIVTVLDLGEEDGKPYLVCEYVPAGDLRQELRKAGGSLPLERALAIGADIARALAVAHARGVIHRDIKPANIWLCDDGSAKLGDFGLAFSIDRTRLTGPYTMLGTAAYMSPEQARGEPVTERSDLYALGALLYEMVCGRAPFVDDNIAAVIAQLLNAQPVAPTAFNSEVPPALEALILQLLSKSPAMRPANAVRVGESLRVIGEGLRQPAPATPAPAVPPGGSEPAPRIVGGMPDAPAGRPGRRVRTRLLTAGGGIVLVGAAAAAFIGGVLLFGGDGGPSERAAVQPTATPQRITVVQGCRSAAPEACRTEFVLSPAVDESGLTIAFAVTYRSDSGERCPGFWQSDRESLATVVAGGTGDTFAVIDVNGSVHRATDVGGVADSSDYLPCNETKLGWWRFGHVPAGPAQFRYFDQLDPVSFEVPASPQAR